MGKFFEDLKKDLLEVIEAEKGEREMIKYDTDNLPADTYVIGEKKTEYKSN